MNKVVQKNTRWFHSFLSLLISFKSKKLQKKHLKFISLLFRKKKMEKESTKKSKLEENPKVIHFPKTFKAEPYQSLDSSVFKTIKQ